MLAGELPPLTIAVSGPPGPPDDVDVHDEFFSIGRTAHDPPLVFLRSVIVANATFLRDVAAAPVEVGTEVLDALDAAFKAIAAWALGVESSAAGRVATWTGGENRASMLRWIAGHQIFAVVTQGLIAAFRDLHAALTTADAAALAAAAEFTVVLLDGAAAALRFTGDMPSDDYLTIIRPRMTPPLVPETFSGLLAADHRYFVKMLRDMKPGLDLLRDLDPSEHARIADALGGVYDSHRFVCEQLVGSSPSLMMAGTNRKTGGEQIETFKALRMRAFTVGRREDRPVATPAAHSTVADASTKHAAAPSPQPDSLTEK